MSFLSAFMGGMPALLLVCIGITAMIGVVHVWLSRASWDANAWVGIWSGLACVFLAARGVQLTTDRPEEALLAGKIAIAMAPYLVWALIGFGRNLGGRGLDRSTLGVLAAISFVWTFGIIGTTWFVDSEVTTRTDFFGRTHLSVHALWPTHLLSVYFAGALVWGVRRLRKQSQLEPGERRMLVLSFSVYAALGVSAVLTSASVISVPAAAELGPVVVAITLSYMMSQRRKRVEEHLELLLSEKSSRLTESEERYRDLVKHAPIGIFVLDEEGTASSLNPRMLEMLGDLDGLDAAGYEEAITQAGLHDTARHALSGVGVERKEHRIKSGATGGVRVWSVTASRLGDDAKPRKVLVLADDATERNALEKQLQQSRKMDSIGRLVAGVAHEINNPMAYVRANLASIGRHREMMQQEWRKISPTGDEAKETEIFDDLKALVEESVEGVERTIRIVQDMGGLVTTEPSAQAPIALAPLLQEILRVHGSAQGEEIELAIGSLPDVYISASPASLRQVFDHLLANAAEAVGGRGRVEIEARLLPTRCVNESLTKDREPSQDVPRVAIRITDDGPGVPREARAGLFDPFFTVGEVAGRTGLGLYIAYQTVRSMGGDLRYVDAEAGKAPNGARFEVILPTAE